MDKYTKGPWSINRWPHSSADMSVGAVGTPKVAIIPLRDVSIKEQEANAYLIAAAPDLLVALERVIEEYADLPPKVLEEIAPDWLPSALAAIAKAKEG